MDADRRSSVFLNGYYDFENGSPVTPFVGVGIGNSTVDELHLLVARQAVVNFAASELFLAVSS